VLTPHIAGVTESNARVDLIAEAARPPFRSEDSRNSARNNNCPVGERCRRRCRSCRTRGRWAADAQGLSAWRLRACHAYAAHCGTAARCAAAAR
jgi:hypothetical protein